MTDEPATADPTAPLLRVVKGNPTPEELAALVVVVAARQAALAPHEPPSESSAWSAPSRRFRQPLYPGPDGWWRSSNPR
jgi:hypothetical protein